VEALTLEKQRLELQLAEAVRQLDAAARAEQADVPETDALAVALSEVAVGVPKGERTLGPSSALSL
jgi:hypothetical protein